MKRDDQGLALLLVVALMALVTLIAVSLAVITRVETSIGTVRNAQNEARQNALHGLEIALGRLQSAAGPDQRVTATAEALGSSNHRHWVGVWRSDRSGTQPETWLVSGSTPTPSMPSDINRQHILLVNADGTEENRVSAPLELLRDDEAGNTVRGGFAYFIADQGLKAQLAAPDSTPAADDVAAQRRALTSGSRPIGFGADRETATWDDRLENTTNPEQWALLDGPNQETIRTAWHDYAAWTRGLLVDTANGGLKTDLSIAGDSAIPGLSRFSELATADRQNELVPSYPMRPASGNSGEFYDGIHPIITQFGLQFDVQATTRTTGALNARMKFFVETSNPYTSALEWADAKIRIYGLPSTLEIDTQSDVSNTDQGSATIDLASYFAEHVSSSGERYIEFGLPAGDEVIPPGRSVNWQLPRSNQMGESSMRDLRSDSDRRDGVWDIRLDETLSGPDNREDDTMLLFQTVDSWDLRLEYYLVAEGGSEVLLTECDFPEFAATEYRSSPASGTIDDVSASQGDFGIHVRLNDREDLSGTERGNDFDERASVWIVSSYSEGLFKNRYSGEDFSPDVDFESDSYNSNFSRTNHSVERRQVFRYGPLPSYFDNYQEGYNADIALLELPRQAWLSIGELQHLPFVSAPLYNVGNSWSGKNDWFDSYYFSGIRANVGGEHDQLNPSLEILNSDLETDLTPGDVWSIGAFNLNSTRSSAWEALLLGTGARNGLLPLLYAVHGSDDRFSTGIANIDPSFGRFTQSAGVVWEITPNPNNESEFMRSYRRGLKTLTSEQIRALASEVTGLLSERIATEGPYRSVADFLEPVAKWGNRNVIEQAIYLHDQNVGESQRINWNHYFPDNPVPIDVGAPTYLTSADIMTALAPQLAARSDTFLVRVYGESVAVSTAGGYDTSDINGRAWLEALVQRYPEGVDPSDFAGGAYGDWRVPVDEPNWGRRFRVIAMRWLNEDDL